MDASIEAATVSFPGLVQRQLDQGGTPAPYRDNLAYPSASGAGDSQPVSIDRVRQHLFNFVHQQTAGSDLQDPEQRDVHSVPLVDS